MKHESIKATGVKPCPFCGGNNIYHEKYEHHKGQWRWRIVCGECLAMIDRGWVQQKSDNVEFWNKRAGDNNGA